jgi:hypothetical protein
MLASSPAIKAIRIKRSQIETNWSRASLDEFSQNVTGNWPEEDSVPEMASCYPYSRRRLAWANERQLIGRTRPQSSPGSLKTRALQL